ncbi:MAG: hypothetical protein MUF34_11130 [Polyangiaceae bacterium]|nr:hypothetical protein [Polyangiaceae bacterium]
MKQGSSIARSRAIRWPWAAAALLLAPLAAAQGAARPATTAAPAPAGPRTTAAPAASGVRAVPALTVAPNGSVAPMAGSPSGVGAGSAPPAVRLVADPAPSMTRKKWAYDVRLKKGQLSAAAPAAVDRGRPQATPRFVGRFAIELLVGNLLLERVRFDLPLVDGGPSKAAAPEESQKVLSKTLNTHRVVEVPDLERATRAELVDVVTGKRLRLMWPPVDAAPSPPAPLASPSPPAASPGPSSSPPKPQGR